MQSFAKFGQPRKCRITKQFPDLRFYFSEGNEQEKKSFSSDDFDFQQANTQDTKEIKQDKSNKDTKEEIVVPQKDRTIRQLLENIGYEEPKSVELTDLLAKKGYETVEDLKEVPLSKEDLIRYGFPDDKNLNKFCMDLKTLSSSSSILQDTKTSPFLFSVEDDVIKFEPNEMKFPSKIYIRKEYEILTKIIKTAITSQMEASRFLILGNPGIGKTYYLYYLCYLLNAENKRVIIKKRTLGEQIQLFMLYKGQISRSPDESYLNNSENWCLVDSDPNPGEFNAITVNVASPNVLNYKQFRKYPKILTLYMDVWEKYEIDVISEFHTGFQTDVVQDRFNKFGGIPRIIFSIENVEIELNEKINESSLEDVVNATRKMKSKRESFSHWFVHWRPDRETHQLKRVTLASTFISNLVAQRYYDREQNNFLQFLKFCKNESFEYGSLRGRLFEYHAHQVLSKGGSFKIRNLGRNEPLRTIDIPPRQEKEVAEFTMDDNNFYCHPKKKTFPGVDSWILGVGFFQMTVGKVHPVDRKFCEILASHVLDSKELPILYFVVPDDLFSSFKYQNMKPVKEVKEKTTNRKRKSTSEIEIEEAEDNNDNLFSEVPQFVLEIPISPSNK